MDPFCNGCFQGYRQLQRDFFCTDCKHVACQLCLGPSQMCPICQKSCRIIKISNTMPESIKMFFKDVRPELETLRKTVEFQQEQRSIGCSHAEAILVHHFATKDLMMQHKEEHDALVKEIKKYKRAKGSQRSFSTHSTPISSISGISGQAGIPGISQDIFASQFTENPIIVRMAAMNDLTLQETPSSSSANSTNVGMSNLTLGPRRPRRPSGGSSASHNIFRK